jgi:glycerophosphoryl diester phosphodiesterase
MEAVAIRITPLRKPPLAFGHRGAEPESPDSPASFALAVKLGATGVESGLWLTADGVPVLRNEGIVRAGLRRRSVAALSLRGLGDAVTPAPDALSTLGPDRHLMLHVGDEAAADSFLGSLAASTDHHRVWLASPDLSQLTTWRERWPSVRLVNVAGLGGLPGGPERRAATLAEMAVDAVQLPYADWTGGLVTLFHRFGVEAFAWNAPHVRILADLLRMGCDGISSAHVDRLIDALNQDGNPSR